LSKMARQRASRLIRRTIRVPLALTHAAIARGLRECARAD